MRDSLCFVGFCFSPIFPSTLPSRELFSMSPKPEVRLFSKSRPVGYSTHVLNISKVFDPFIYV